MTVMIVMSWLGCIKYVRAMHSNSRVRALCVLDSKEIYGHCPSVRVVSTETQDCSDQRRFRLSMYVAAKA